jgi:dienelactone hydrolase
MSGGRFATGSGGGRVNGALTWLVARVRVIAEAIDELGREVSVDSSIVAVGRCRGGPTSHVMAAAGHSR